MPFESGTGLTNVTREPSAGYVGQSIGEIIIQSGQSYPRRTLPLHPSGDTLGTDSSRREVERNRRWSTENIDIIVGLRVARYFETDPDNLGGHMLFVNNYRASEMRYIAYFSNENF